ncbi:sugar ABC transporter ATP-binding protein (plasmid) [Deinococcus metallilatus]|uniref:Ribose transport system ATP-binding protein n=1 Tax=Deinococcus metallilatus TaxID=1211322 RepID=A0AAJ5JZV1_9DEIO|nr:sugar ABC transporter ATP-binding protein [Deinococcus metallilatus]MBB5293481.1 ribose transport system ATP-binding protein [Deinococcus metallilatus]QBY06564.1 sugar ABC transporter ATP-binding protein [Deinococcus metallilatus]RXJ17907.1 sugar ABC transporter ATP-binding protein [Deinococcus metallilatus]TLK32179.1 sugar ABC transporter ATP-binding protein [Deinococcus metallilatus]GMA15299.1 ABC transporter ATP-binding protein [Deinococcus metallilatus]
MTAPEAVPAVAFQGISKTFGPVEVLHDVTFSVAPGEVHALLGENGAGKSTLMKILGGYLAPTRGEVRLSGQPAHFRDSRDAEARGIVLIHQEFNLAEDLTVAQNIFLGHERGGLLLNDAAMGRGAREALARLGVTLDPRLRVRDLTVPQKQLVEIARALSRQARVLILDEPTATLTLQETERLFRLMRHLREEGVTMLYISHKLDEVKAIADRVTVLRDGRYVTTAPAGDLTQQQMANLMVGRELEAMFPPRGQAGPEELLRVEGLDVPGWAQGVSFTLRRGEVLGFAGLVGAGRTETFEGLLGLRPHRIARLEVRGRAARFRGPGDAARAGVVYLSEDRKGKGLHVNLHLRPNLTLMTLGRYAHPLLDVQAERAALRRAAQDYGIRAGRLDVPASALSGGNQQKLALAKILEVNPDVIILDEPTRGVDVGAKREIYHLIQQLAAQGKGVIVISSELPELLGLCQRLLVMHGGRVVGELGEGRMSEHEVIQYATGLKVDDHLRRDAHVHT